MKIVFMGTPEFAVPSLRALVNSGYEIAAVVTNPDEPQGRGLKVLAPAIKDAANELGLPVVQVAALKEPGFADTLNDISPDLIVVVAFRILPKEIFTIPKLGTFNLHASLLPRYRGAAPINWAIVDGESETGVTTFFLDEKVDTGRIILQKKTTIGTDETAGELAGRLSAIGSDAVVETVKIIEGGRVQVIEQDGALASRAPKISKEDCLIEWSKPAGEVHNFIRGFSPEPAAFSYMKGKLLKLFKTKRTGVSATDQPGEISVVNGRLFVACADEKLEVLELQLEGKKKLDAREFVRGARIESDTRLIRSRT
ncbi:MAG: methionyl-tRNA formyltransferase [Bacteroidetes bacterium]|nr:methionyl-tRNA formyltransferase [Bacteroidota bacterium]